MNVKTIMRYDKWMSRKHSLNGNLDEKVYMMQPNGFIAKDQEYLVCKLHKFIYELKKASRSWNRCFN